MAVQVTQEPREQVVTLISDVKLDEVSLVRHGANWTPFTIIKAEGKPKGASQMPGQVIQAILMPVGKDIESLREQLGDEWYAGVKTDRCIKSDGWNRYEQRPEADFVQHELEGQVAFKLLDIPTGGMFVAGELTKDAQKADGDALLVPNDDMWTTVATEPFTITYSFAELFWEKLAAYEGVITGVMSLETDASKRIRAHQDAWKAVDDFVRAALDKIGSKSVKMNKPNSAGDQPVQGEPEMTKEEVQTLIKSGVDETKAAVSGLTDRLAAIEDAVSKMAKTNEPETNDGNTNTQDAQDNQDTQFTELAEAFKNDMTSLNEMVANLATAVSGLSEKQDALQHSVIGTPSNPEDEDVQTSTKGEGGSVFKGMFGKVR